MEPLAFHVAVTIGFEETAGRQQSSERLRPLLPIFSRFGTNGGVVDSRKVLCVKLMAALNKASQGLAGVVDQQGSPGIRLSSRLEVSGLTIAGLEILYAHHSSCRGPGIHQAGGCPMRLESWAARGKCFGCLPIKSRDRQ